MILRLCASSAALLLATASAQDLATVVALPTQPYVVPLIEETYRFPDPRSPDVLTQRNDNNRSGTSHWPRVNQQSIAAFRKLGEIRTGGVLTAQPLFAGSALVRGRRQPALILATSMNEVWAVSPSAIGETFWRTRLGPPVVADRNGSPVAGGRCDLRPLAAWQEWATLAPNQSNGLVGIEATPVVDLANNQVLAGYKSVDGRQHVAAIDLDDGRVRKDAVIAPPHAGANPHWNVLHRNRASLLLADGVVYLAFSSLCEGDTERMHGSVVAFDARTLERVGDFQVTDDTTDGGGIWQASTGLAADTRGSLYFSTGNRRLCGAVPAGELASADIPNLASSIVRVKVEKRPDATAGQAGYRLSMAAADHFSPYRRTMEDCYDLDLGSAGVVLLPGTRFAAAGGKQGIVYVLNRADLGHHESSTKPWDFASVDGFQRTRRHVDARDDPNRDRVQQKFQAAENVYDHDGFLLPDWMRWPHIHGTPAFARFADGEAFLYVWPEKDRIKRFAWDPTSQRFDPRPMRGDPPAPPFVRDDLNGMPGGMLSVNVDPGGPRLGVVLASVKICSEPGYPACTANQDRGILRAYDPFTMREVWSNRGESYWFAKFVPPTVAAGRIFLATASGKVLVYGP